MTDYEKMHSGEIYNPSDDTIFEEQIKCLDRLYDFNMTRPTEMEKREKMLKEMLAEIGENCYIEPPFHSNWGGKNVHLGKNVYFNFNGTCIYFFRFINLGKFARLFMIARCYGC